MKTVVLLLLGSLSTLLPRLHAADTSEPSKPNIVVVFGDPLPNPYPAAAHEAERN